MEYLPDLNQLSVEGLHDPIRELAYEQKNTAHSWAQELSSTLVDALKACDAARAAGSTAL